MTIPDQGFTNRDGYRRSMMRRGKMISTEYADMLGMLGTAAKAPLTPAAAKDLNETSIQVRRIAGGLTVRRKRIPEFDTVLYRLLYVSRAVEADPLRLAGQAEAIARVSAQRNAQGGLTGALAVGAGWFAQLLEGVSRPLLATFDRIIADPRHTDIRVLDFGVIETRDFASWSMGFSGGLDPSLLDAAASGYEAQELNAQPTPTPMSLALVGSLRAAMTQHAQL
jgi:hypothetical protein